MGLIMTNLELASSATLEKLKLRQATRQEKVAARREAILAAALIEFSAQGFVPARLEDVAKRAGVAKGTIYLHFPDKEALFVEIVRSTLPPIVAMFKTAMDSPMPARQILEIAADLFVREVYYTNRRYVLQLIFMDGVRFPKVMSAYYDEIQLPLNNAIRGLLKRAFEHGEITEQAMIRFPQLMVAPWLAAIVWRVMFESFDPLDVNGLLRAHIDQVFGSTTVRSS
jgi:AcrR family transcriptional regulator